MTYQPLEFAAVPRPYRLGNDQLRRYNRVRSGQKKQGRINIAIDIITVLLLLSALIVVARRWHQEWDDNEDLVIFSNSHAALRAARRDGAIMTACARMQLAWFVGFLAIGGIAVATESALLAALVSLPLAMGLVNSWRSCQALRRIIARTL